MEALILTVVAILLSCGAYLILDRTLLRVIIGVGLLSNGVNLLIVASSGLQRGSAPILHDGSVADGVLQDAVIHGGRAASVDPLPQALVLTAIVIGFGVSALLLTLAYRTYQTHGTDDLGELHGRMTDE